MMFSNYFKRNKSLHRDTDSKRRRREAILIVVILFVVALLTFVETRTIRFGADIPVSNTILMFILININLLLLILLIFLVFRNLVKLLYDRRRKVMGAKLRTRLVVAFIVLTIVPTVVLFFFSINFITTSLEFWFNVPVEQALENSLRVGGRLYDRVAANNQFFLERISYQVQTKQLLHPAKEKALVKYIRVVQREFNLDAVEVYGANTQRITVALASELDNDYFGLVSAENLQKDLAGGGVWTLTPAQLLAGDQHGDDESRPWRLLHINRGIVATRSHDLEVMKQAFDEFLIYLPQEATGFFAEGMKEMDALDYPSHVRKVMEFYYHQNSSVSIH